MIRCFLLKNYRLGLHGKIYLVVKLSQVTKELITVISKFEGELAVLVAIIFLQITRFFDQLP